MTLFVPSVGASAAPAFTVGVKAPKKPLKDITQRLNCKAIIAEKIRDNSSKLQRRKIVKGNRALEQAPTIAKGDLKEMIPLHASERVQIFLLKAIALQNKDLRSDGSKVDVKVEVGPARLQMGQSDIEGYHACHADAAAGLVDNRKERYAEEIIRDGYKMTPRKEKVLVAKIPKAELESIIKNNPDLHALKDALNSAWKENSLLEGSALERQTNLTNFLPKEVNLLVDGAIEKQLRPKIAELYTDVRRGDLTPQEATEKYVQLLRNQINREIADINIMWGKATPEQRTSELDAQVQKILEYFELELDGTHEPDYALFGLSEDPKSARRSLLSSYEMLQPFSR